MKGLRKYTTIFKSALLNRLQYRNEVFGLVFISLFALTGILVFWFAVYEGKGEISGFTIDEIVTYYLLMGVVSGIVNSYIGFRLSEDVLSGKVTMLLLKPVNAKIQLLFSEMGELFIDILVKAAIFIPIIYLATGNFSIEYKNLPVFILSLTGSYLISLNLNWMLGLVAFWTTNVDQLVFACRRIFVFLGGGVVPLAFFPEFAQDLLKFLPFAYIIDLPLQVIVGNIEGNSLLIGLFIQLVWVIILHYLGDLIFSWSVKHNQSVGI